MVIQVEVVKCQLIQLPVINVLNKYLELQKMFRSETKRKMKMTKMLTLISTLFKMKTLDPRESDVLLSKTSVFRIAHPEVHLAKVINKMTVKKAWAWEWEIDKGAVMMWRMKVVVWML